MTAMFMTAVAISGVIGGPLSGWILRDLAGLNGWAGWQWMFLIEGLPSIAVGIVVLFYLDDRIAHAKWLSPDEKALLARHIEVDNAHKVDEPVGRILMTGRVWLMGLIYFAFVMGLYGMSFWLPTIIKQTGIADALTIGLLSAIPWACAVVAMVVVARHADRTGERRWHIAIPAFIGAAGLVFSVLFRDNTTLAMAGLTVGAMGIMITLPLFWSLPTAFLAGTAAAAGIALINSLGNLSGFVAPYAVGWLKDQTSSTDSGVYLLAISLVIGGLLTLAVPAKLVRSPAPL